MATIIRERWLILLLASLLLILIVYPYLEGSVMSDILLNCLQAGIVLAAVVVVSTDWRHTTLAVVFGVVSLLSGWVPTSQEDLTLTIAGSAGGIAFYLYATVSIARHLLRTPEVTFDTLCGAFCVYLLLGFLWTEAYCLLEHLHPGAVRIVANPGVPPQWSDLLYFSFTTMTGAAYGDVVPAIAKARSIAMLESATSVLYVAVMIARLVGLYNGRG